MKETMIPLSAVSRFKWDAECGKRLELVRMRQTTSRQSLADAIAQRLEVPEGKSNSRIESGSCSARYIQKLEKDEMVSIPAEILTAITDILGVSISELIATDAWKVERG